MRSNYELSHHYHGIGYTCYNESAAAVVLPCKRSGSIPHVTIIIKKNKNWIKINDKTTQQQLILFLAP